MQEMFQQFENFLLNERRYSEHTVQAYMRDLRDFYTFLNTSGSAELVSLTYQDMRLYLVSLNERALSQISISRKLSSLRSFFKYALLRGWIDTNPMALIQYQAKRQKLPKFFYEKEIEQLIEVAKQDESPEALLRLALIEMLYATGMRVSECCNLKVSMIDFHIQMARIIGKGNKERIVPIGDEAMSILQKYMQQDRQIFLNRINENHNHSYVFITPKGKPITAQYVRKLLQDLIKKNGLTFTIHPHKLRHTFATHLLNHGADMRSVQELLGHADLSSTQIYTHVTKDNLRRQYLNTHPRAKRLTKGEDDE